MVSPSAKRLAARYLIGERGYSERRACSVVKLDRSSFRYDPRPRAGEAELVRHIRELADQRKEYGYRRIAALLNREGANVNKKRVHRIWKEEGLQQPLRRPKRRRRGPKGEVIRKAEHPNHVWTYDFLEDRTERGGKLRILTVLDEYTRECLAILVDRSIPARAVIEVLDGLFLTWGAPEYLRSDNGPELMANAVQEWLKGKGWIYIEPASPWENPYIESFNGRSGKNV